MFKIITNSTGLGETGEIYLVDKNGYLISPGDWQSLAKKIIEVATNFSLLNQMINFDDNLIDFKDEEIFKELLFIPPEWREEFDLKVILKEEPIHITPEAVLFLTNIQQLEKRVLCYYNRLIVALGMQNSAVRNVQR